MNPRDSVAGRFTGIWHDIKNAHYNHGPRTRGEVRKHLTGETSASPLKQFGQLFEILDDLGCSPPMEESSVTTLARAADSSPQGRGDDVFAGALEEVARAYENEHRNYRNRLEIYQPWPRAEFALALRQMRSTARTSEDEGTDLHLVLQTGAENLAAAVCTALSPLFPSLDVRASANPAEVLRLIHGGSPDALICTWIQDEMGELFLDPQCPSPGAKSPSWRHLPSSPDRKIRQIKTNTLLLDLTPCILSSIDHF